MTDHARVAQVLLLGVFHFERSTDFVGVELDILAPRRQHEIAEVVERLAGFEPTIILVEALPEEQEAVDRHYEEFRSGERQPGLWEELRAREREDQERIGRSSICDELVQPNSASKLARDHCLYVTTTRVGAGQGNVGADLPGTAGTSGSSQTSWHSAVQENGR